MILRKLKKKNNNKGFTLIEMVIVITIIGLITGISVAKYGKVQENAKLNADYATAANLATAASMALNDGIDDVTVSNLEKENYIQFQPTSKSNKGKSFDITPSAEKDSVTVKIGTQIFYPKEKQSSPITE